MRSLLTIGYGNRELRDVVGLLERENIRFLVDVRSAPYSRFNPAFTKDHLADALEAHRIKYVFMGDVIGGRPEDPRCYDDAGHVDYLACRRHPTFRAGLDRLRSAWQQDLGVAIFCSELHPQQCHRTKLIAEDLVAAGVPVEHIDADGSVVGHAVVMDRLVDPQLSLIAGHSKATRSRGQFAPAPE